MDSAQSILRSAKHFFVGTLFSRFSGLMRDITMAFCFGSGPAIAGFMVSYRLANLFRRLLGEGNVAAGFVPLFEHHRGENQRSAALFYRDVAWSMALLAIAVVVGLELILWVLKNQVSENWLEIVELAMWMGPGLLFLCLFSLHAALLQCQKKAFWPGFAPVAFNFAWIFAALLSAQTAQPMHWLALGVTAACAMQWLLTGWQVRKELDFDSSWFKPRLFTPEWRAMLRPMALGLIGVGAMQINSALDAIFARIADPSGPAFLWYAIRIQQLPLALFGIALSGALLPPLSRAMREGDLDRYRQLLQSGLKHVLALMVPCTFGLFALGRPGLNLLYGHGDFTPADVEATLECLWAYGLGLIPAVLVLILAQGFYAKKSYTLPTYASLFAVAVNVALNAWLVFGLHWGATSIAIATSFSSMANYHLLSRALELPSLLKDSLFWRLTLACSFGAALSMGFQSLWPIDPRGLFLQAAQFGCSAMVYGAVLLGAAFFLKIEPLLDLLPLRRQAKS